MSRTRSSTASPDRSSACSSNNKYSFVIVEIKEVVSWVAGQKVVEFVPC